MADSPDLSLGEGYFVNYYPPQLGEWELKHEYLHPEYLPLKPHYALTETQYFAFYVPEKNLHCYMTTWYHPQLNSVTAGVMGFYGFKKISLACEMIDMRNHHGATEFKVNYPDVQLDNSLRIDMVEPGKVFRVRYDDPKRGNSFDVTQTAVAPVMMWPGNKHFEQVMRCEGQITLRGTTHEVNCLSVRDRSWGEYRLEDPMPIPPNAWVTGVFDEGFSFHVTGMDHPDLDPIWKGKFEVDPARVMRFGWMIVDGEPLALKSMKKKVDYDRETMLPVGITIDMVDTRGREFKAVGRILATSPLNLWLNIRAPISLVEWTCNGKIGHGEVQDVQFNDFLYAYAIEDGAKEQRNGPRG